MGATHTPVRIANEQYEQIKQIAASEDRTIETTVKRLLAKALERGKQHQIELLRARIDTLRRFAALPMDTWDNSVVVWIKQLESELAKLEGGADA